MKILIIGGTRFLGKSLVEAALERGHQLTLFNRGQSNPDWFPQVEKLHGDRNIDLSNLIGRGWDAVIDTSAYFPRQVRSLLTTFGRAIHHYTFISSISVYADFSRPGVDETSPTAVIPDPTIETITGETYGALKALSEQAALEALPDQALIIRPGLIVGPYDPTDRFTYWPVRVSRGGEMLAPDSPHWETQIIDVRDLAEWNIRLVEQKQSGVFNATGPADPLTFGEVLTASQDTSGAHPNITWAQTQFLLAQGVEPWSELPLWLPTPEEAGANQINIQKALEHGLTFRALTETIRDTLAWESTRPVDHPWRAGLTQEKETALLSILHDEDIR